MPLQLEAAGVRERFGSSPGLQVGQDLPRPRRPRGDRRRATRASPALGSVRGDAGPPTAGLRQASTKPSAARAAARASASLRAAAASADCQASVRPAVPAGPLRSTTVSPITASSQ